MTGHLILSIIKIMTKTFMKRMMNLFEIQKVREAMIFWDLSMASRTE